MSETLIVAFAPSDADYASNGHCWTLYNPDLDNPYAVEDADEKLREAVEKIDPHAYELADCEHWIRLDWQSVLDGDPERIMRPPEVGRS